MKFFDRFRVVAPDFKSICLAVISSLLLVAAFPDFEIWILAWFGLIPLFMAIDREKDSVFRSTALGWIWGTAFFFGTCWWLTFAPITYAGVPAIFAYSLMFCAAAIGGFYIAIFAGIYSLLVRNLGGWGLLTAPIVWTTGEFLRLWTSGNNWNAIGYSQAFTPFSNFATVGGVFLVSFIVVSVSTLCFWYIKTAFGNRRRGNSRYHPGEIAGRLTGLLNSGAALSSSQQNVLKLSLMVSPIAVLVLLILLTGFVFDFRLFNSESANPSSDTYLVAVQPNVPMSGLGQSQWNSLRKRQVLLAETGLKSPGFSTLSNLQAESDALPDNVQKRTRFYEELALASFRTGEKLVVLPESPMNYQYDNDPGFRKFIGDFARRNNISVLFNSAEPDPSRKDGFFNSAVMVDKNGAKTEQYDKIHLLPFGEFVPLPEVLAKLVPPMVGRFSPGKEYDLLPVGNAKAGIMICFESHFPSLSREYVRNGADVLIEMTNDGYLGNTPVLRQHLASAMFRAVETNRPVLRVTNVGVTAYISGRGKIFDQAGVYQEALRVWPVRKTDGRHTIYVRYGDWFAVLCLIVTLGLSFACFWYRPSSAE